MSASNRAALISKTYKVLKKYYKPVKPPADRTLLEHLLYACCLENATHEAADEAFAKVQQAFFDWNEIRVTTVAELAETMSSLVDPAAAAMRLKKCLQSVFETHYAFDIEALQKQNLGKAIEQLEKFNGMTSFVVAYVSQNGLGGHSIPTSLGTLDALEVIGMISEADAKKHRVPGLERAISKAKGVEFASLLHQLGADFFASPWGSKVRTILVEIEPEAKDRLPQRSLQADGPASGAGPPSVPPARTAVSPPSPKGPPAEAADAAKKKKAPRTPEAAEEPAEEREKPERKPGHDASKDPADEKRSPTKQLSRKKPR
ncbi:MAG: hypothetical protein NTY19_29350 [Planctomycetota bacterium]|nr:hypothetical protein [Planctomycetota bacterium]